MSPQQLYRAAAVAEVITWALLLAGMFAKYVTQTTDLGVTIFGALHGFVFLAFCASTLLVAIDQRWSARRIVLGLACAVPPFATVPFERWAGRRGLLGSHWRLREGSAHGPSERLVAAALRRPIGSSVLTLLAVTAVFTVLLIVGPPTQLVTAD